MKYDYDENIPDHFTVSLDENTNKKVQEALKDVCREIVDQVVEDKIINGAATVYFHLDVLAVRKRTGNEPFGEEKNNELS